MNRGKICLEKPRNDLEFSVRTIFFLRVVITGRKQNIAIRQVKVRTREPIPIACPRPVSVRLAWLYFPRQLPSGAINSTPIA